MKPYRLALTPAEHAMLQAVAMARGTSVEAAAREVIVEAYEAAVAKGGKR